MRRIPGAAGWAAGAAVLALVTAGAALAPHDPVSSVAAPWTPPGAEFPLGTDAVGRDVLSRVAAGGGPLVATAALAAGCASAAGILGGMVAGWHGGWADRVLSAAADLLLSIPFLLVAMVLAIALPGPAAVVAGTVCAGAPLSLRVVRDAVRRLRRSGFVEAALGRGERAAAIWGRELLPGLAGLAAADLALRFVVALQLASALGMLGLGPQPPAPDWGLMLRENLPGARLNPLALIAPAVALTATALVAAVLAHAAADGHPRLRRPAGRRR